MPDNCFAHSTLDLLPIESIHPLDVADGETRSEELELSRSDDYLAGQYERVISLSTHMIGLEHHHDRVHVYNEWVRGALARRQWRSDEVLHTDIGPNNAHEIEKPLEFLNLAIEQRNGIVHAFLGRLHVDIQTDLFTASESRGLSRNIPDSRP